MALGNFGRDLLAEASRIAQQTVARDGTHLRWATVTDTEPLRIRYDGEPNPSIVTPQNTAAGLDVGDRVQVGKQNGQATIIGPADGHRAITDGTNTLRIGDDGRPFLGSDPGLVYDRAYGQNVTAPGNARLALVTRFGTIGTLNERLPREYMPFNYASGTFSATVDAANTPKMHTITFPAGTFTSPPRVLMSYFLSIPDYAAISLFSVDTTNFSFYVTRKNTQPTTIVWRAFEDL